MSAKLLEQRYGKARVRVLKVLRDGPVQALKELEVSVLLSGDFASSYTSGDNSKVVATDTVKNTVNALAKEHLGAETERFVVTLARHFVSKYPQVEQATVETSERVWDRLTIGGEPHPHSFSGGSGARPCTRVSATAGTCEIQSGLADLLILKSTASGFTGYPRCEYTTLPETTDRIFATALAATWTWSAEPASYPTANALILAALLEPFARNYSPSVQTTLFQMGEAALAACPEISRIHLAAPNKHCLLINLAPFGLENPNEIFVPIDEPHGQIEATIGRT